MTSSSVEEWIEEKLREGANKKGLKEVLEDKGHNPAKVDEVANSVFGEQEEESTAGVDELSDNPRDTVKRSQSQKNDASLGLEESEHSTSQKNTSGRTDAQDFGNLDAQANQAQDFSNNKSESFIEQRRTIIVQITVFLISLVAGIGLGFVIF